MLRVLDALQFIQKQFQIGLRYYKQLNAVFNRLTVFTGVLIYDMLPCAVVVGKALRNQQSPLSEVTGEVLVEIGNQVCRREAASGTSDFCDNDRLDKFTCVCSVKIEKIYRFQSDIHNSPQQV